MTKTPGARRRLIVASLAVLGAWVILAPPVSADDQPLTAVLRRWTTAVAHHIAGTSDAAVAAVWAMTPADRAVIRTRLRVLLGFLDGADYTKVSDHDVLAVATVASALLPMSRFEFLERAATLHADAVIFDARPPGSLGFDEAQGRGRRGATPESGGQGVFVTSTDGEFVKATVENPNWPLARLLLDALPAGRASQAFATTWYHGVTAQLFARRDLGEAEQNLDHALDVMPQSAPILFDLGCIAEVLGMNLFQQVIPNDQDPLLQRRPGVIPAPDPTQSAKSLNRKAAGLFERALESDPHLAEARVRWARLLELEERWTDAAQQIDLAEADHPDPDLAFYAHLFGARAANALNDATGAEEHLTEALRLYPHAESAILEASDTALRHSDPTLAKDRLMALAEGGRDQSRASDPWRQYSLGPGRPPILPLQTLWRAVRGGVR